MPQAWSDKRERQYQHIKEQAEERGTDQRRAKEIAARTVNKNRAQAGELKESSPTSKAQLYQDARKAGIRGRSSMTKKQLQRALDNHTSSTAHS
jgi:hypothetical protein